MTTAHRPTWKPAYGLSDSVNKGYVPTRSYSARDLPSYLKLKERKIGQGAFEELREKDFRAELLQREAEAQRKKNGEIDITEDRQITYGRNTSIYAGDVDFIGTYEPEIKKKVKVDGEELVDLQDNPFPEDADSEEFVREESEEKQKKRVQSESQDDDDDESEQLLREYERIKEQRQKEELHKRQEKHKQSLANRQAELLKGNPLIDSSYSLTKRWYEDTVFRNQARKVQEKKSYINDYVRSDFHRKFMHRYICR